MPDIDAGAVSAARRPNIVCVVLDSVRAQNCSAYGYASPTTPHLEKLAAEGVLYEQAASVGCWTLPVHTSLFTGMYPARHGVTISAHALANGVPTLAEQLTTAGYRTACFSNNAYISSASGLSRGFEHVDELWRVTNPRGVGLPRLSQRIKELERRGPLLRPVVGLLRRAKRARAILKAWRSRKDSGAAYTNERIAQWLQDSADQRPFFIFVNYMEAHEPYLPPYPYNRRFVASRFSPWRVVRVSGRRDEILLQQPSTRAEDLEILQGLYDGTVRYSDERVAELTGILRSAGVLDTTFLAVTSDHGDAFGEHGHLGHRLSLYEELLRVPLVIRYPPAMAAGRRVPVPVPIADLHPTILELAGAQPTVEGDFRSLLREAEDRPVVAENTGPKSMNGVITRSWREGPLKLIWHSDGMHELYDLASDPGEHTNLATRDAGTARHLVQRLEAWVRAMEDRGQSSGDASYDDETLERLRGLGYVG
ncbi:MAG TPA: sulfatase [Candidatus Limnocylindria bacterium]|nr:sulfatase [Candidatus Limnocylindria bacterium]